MRKNANELELALKLKIKTTPNTATILKILKNFRLCIAEYIKYKFKLFQKGEAPELNRTLAIDQTLILHKNNRQIWLVGELIPLLKQ